MPLAPVRMSGQAGSVADLLLTFDASAPTRVRRGAGAWVAEPALAEASWRLHLSPTTPARAGTPLRLVAHGPHHAWLLGELYDADGDPDRVVAELVDGRRDAAELNGHFLLVAWDETARRWRVWTSRFGTLHAYVAASRGRVAIGTLATAVAAAASERTLDWQALAGFFSSGFFPADRTHYTDVRVLRPASEYTFADDGQLVASRRYWQWHHEPTDRGDLVDRFAAAFHDALDDEAGRGDRLAVPISGGLDSRSTVAALTRRDAPHRGDQRLWAYSYGYRTDSIEMRIARQVAAARRLPIDLFTIRPYLFDRLADSLDATEGFQDVTQHRQSGIADALRGRADAVVAAHWGDVWLDDMGASDAATDAALVDVAARRMQKRGRAWLLDMLCRPRLATAPDAVTRGFLEDGLGEVAHIADPDFRLKAFKTDHWSHRWTLTSLRAFQASAFPRLPFYDTRVTDFFAGVSTDRVRARRLQVEYLKRYAPDLAGVTWQAQEANLYLYPYASLWRRPRSAVRKVWRLARGERPLQRNWEVQLLGPSGRAGLQRWLLEPGLALHDHVAPSEVAALLQGFHTSPDAANGYSVSMLLTFSAWLELHHRA